MKTLNLDIAYVASHTSVNSDYLFYVEFSGRLTAKKEGLIRQKINQKRRELKLDMTVNLIGWKTKDVFICRNYNNNGLDKYSEDGASGALKQGHIVIIA